MANKLALKRHGRGEEKGGEGADHAEDRQKVGELDSGRDAAAGPQQAGHRHLPQVPAQDGRRGRAGPQPQPAAEAAGEHRALRQPALPGPAQQPAGAPPGGHREAAEPAPPQPVRQPAGAGRPAELGALRALRSLNLGMNRIETLPRAPFFQGLAELRELGLFDNLLGEPPEVARSLPRVHRLNA
ncbi:hypothetical protein ANANG_G00306480, partial [Anguilla anguilla]